MALTVVKLTAGVTGTLPIANGGTNSTSTTFVNLASNVTGTMPVANGGTNLTSGFINGVANVGKIGQVVETNYTTYAANTSATLNTGMSRTITPSATSSKIFVILLAQMSKEAENNTVIGRLFREVGGSVTATRLCTDHMHWDGGTYGKRQSSIGISWLDSPSSVAEITYQFAWGPYDSSLTVQINNYNAGGSYASQMTCWEVLA